jgi:zinc protease
MVAYERAGPFVMMVQTRNDQAVKVRNTLDELLRRLVEKGPSEEEFDAAKKRLLGQFPMLFASNQDTLHVVAWMAFYDYPSDYLETYQAQLQAMTLDDLKKVIRQRISLDAIQTVVVGP